MCRKTYKRANAVVLRQDVFVADKFGDVYSYVIIMVSVADG